MDPFKGTSFIHWAGCSLVFGIVVLSWAAMARNVLCMLELWGVGGVNGFL